jgi:hypothetical protein
LDGDVAAASWAAEKLTREFFRVSVFSFDDTLDPFFFAAFGIIFLSANWATFTTVQMLTNDVGLFPHQKSKQLKGKFSL